MRRLSIPALLVALLSTQPLSANPVTHLLKSGGRTVIGHGGRAVGREGIKQATRQAANQATRHALRAAAGSKAAIALRHFGDDAIWVGGRLVTKPLSYADDLARVSGSLTARNHRRLMMLAPELKKSGKAGSVIAQLAKSSKADKAVDLLWRHRGKLAAVTAVGAAAWHADAIAEAGGKYVVKPAIEGAAEHIARPLIAQATPWLSLLCIALGVWGLVQLGKLKRLASALLGLSGRRVAAISLLLRQAQWFARTAIFKRSR